MIKSLVSVCLLVYAISHIDFLTNFNLFHTKKLKKIRSFSTFVGGGEGRLLNVGLGLYHVIFFFLSLFVLGILDCFTF